MLQSSSDTNMFLFSNERTESGYDLWAYNWINPFIHTIPRNAALSIYLFILSQI